MESINTTTSNIFIDLDALFDTRLPVLYALDKDTAIEAMRDRNYHKRRIDRFGVIPQDMFYSFYDNRDKEVLLLATPTPMINMLTKYCIEALEHKVITGDKSLLIVYLNIHPYNLDLEEQHNLEHLLMSRIPDIGVRIVSVDNYELNSKWCVGNVGTIIKYDSVKWLETQIATNGIYTVPMIDINLIGPSIVYGNMKPSEIKADIFKQIMVGAASMITMTLIKTAYFSTV